MITVNIINDKTNELWETIELEDETVDIIKKLGMSVEEGITKALQAMVDEYEKNPKGFAKMMKEAAAKSKSDKSP